jgi:hypothetical protein
MAVADGHGGARYSRSRAGSAIACQVALELGASHLAAWSTGSTVDLEPVRHFLQQLVPERIVSRWREDVQQHWQDHPPDGDEPFTPLTYGTTLGLVLLTPHWWATTGLGDWDLVHIDADGQAQLISHEEDVGGRSEATQSLCLSDAPSRFASRTQIHRLQSGDPPFALLLSTDGVRKSCSTDKDYCTLARHLVESTKHDSAPGQLEAHLDQISRQGSGDDVSVAITRWACPDDGHQLLGRPPNPSCCIEQPDLKDP